jgi:Protein of unknown function (DUF3500)
MKRITIITALCLGGLLPAGWLLWAAQQRTQKIATTPAPPLRIESAKESDATGKTVAAAKAFLATLDEAGRAKANFPFNSELKSKWSNFPVGVVPRNGVRWGDLNATQREAALKLLNTALSKDGVQRIQGIMEADEAYKLGNRGPGGGGPPNGGGGPPGGGQPQGGGGPGGRGGGMNGPNFGRDNYYIAFFGAPSLAEPWMLQYGGHHLAINVTIAGKLNVLAPTLTGAQPATFQLNGETVRPLNRETDKSFALINALDAAQQKQAILPFQISDLILGAGEDGKTIAPEGLKVSALNAAQKEKLLDVIHEWVGILNDGAAAAKMAEIKASLNDTWLAWSGPMTKGSAAYYRIQGPTLFIEFAPQRMRGSGGLDGDHIHTIYRDPTNDYGARLVKK